MSISRMVPAALIVFLTIPASTQYAQCPGLCGDVDSSGSIQSVDLISLFAYVSSADSSGLQMTCSNVDDHSGVTIRDLLFIAGHLVSGWPIDCDISSGPYIATPNPGYLLLYNSIYPAGDTSVTLYVDGAFSGETKAVGVVLEVRVAGEIPDLIEVVPTAMAGGSSNWEVVGFNGPGTGNVPAGMLMGAFWSADLGAPDPGRHPLGKATLIMPASALPRDITVDLVEFPPESNRTVAHQAPNWDSDVWSFEPAPWIIDLTGDVNNDRTITAADIIGSVNYVFKGGAAPYPFAASADVNCSGSVTSADIIGLVNFVFKSGLIPCDVATECSLTDDSWTCP